MDKTPTVQNTKYGSPAFRAGLYPGDRLLELDGIKVESIEHLKSMVQGLENLEVPITYQRGEHSFTTLLRLGNDKKIGASFTEGTTDVTEVWIKDSVDPAKNPTTDTPKEYTNPYSKSSSWVTLFRNLGWLSLIAFTLSLLMRIFTDGFVSSNLLFVFAMFFLINTFFAHQLQISIDTRWLLGETHKALKKSQKSK
jgi:hypothetical protein